MRGMYWDSNANAYAGSLPAVHRNAHPYGHPHSVIYADTMRLHYAHSADTNGHTDWNNCNSDGLAVLLHAPHHGDGVPHTVPDGDNHTRSNGHADPFSDADCQPDGIGNAYTDARCG